MPQLQAPDVTDILGRIASWPAEERRNLARQILRSLAEERPSRPSSAKSLRNLLGLLKTDGPPPADDECRRILEDELIRKYLG